jgi:integrase
LAAGISRVKSVKSTGIRVGNWLSVHQAQSLLNAPDVTTVRGLRDRAILAVLLGCALRRSEVAALTFAHNQQRDGRWCIVDLVGKHGRVRTAPMPTWVKVAIDAWSAPAGIVAGHVFRPVNRAGRAAGERLGEKVVWQMLQQYAEAIGVPGIAPHDLRRYAARARGSAERLAASWSKSSCCWATRRFRRPSATWAPSKTWPTHPTTRSDSGLLFNSMGKPLVRPVRREKV